MVATRRGHADCFTDELSMMKGDGAVQLKRRKENGVGKSVLDAIQAGDWNYEPTIEIEPCDFCATNAEPGSPEKLAILAQRIRSGYPLWHPEDRHTEDFPIVLATSFGAVSSLG